MGILGSFLGQAAWGAGQYLAQNAAVNAAHKGVDAYKSRAQGTATPDAVYDSEGNLVPFDALRVFGTPGASLFTAYDLDEGARDAGIRGEQKVAQELERLAALYPNMYVFHSVKLPGQIGDIDHLVVQGDKMMLVDSKNWKGNAAYNVYHSDEDGDYITRDGNNFVGGEIHLRRQMNDWQREFRHANLRVSATLVMANRTSTAAVSINTPYVFANIIGLEQTFAQVFYQAAVPPMQPVLLNRMLSLVDTIGGPVMLHPSFTSARAVRQPSTTGTKLLIGWSVFNWTVMWLLFVIAGLSAIPLLIVTHRHLAKVKRENLGGKGLLTAVLVWTYLQIALWVPFVIFAGLNFL
jgi:hypothetical protein